MDAERLRALVAEVEFRDWELVVGEDEDALWLQWRFDEVDLTGSEQAATEQRCRKWRVSFHMTDGEVVQTALLAALTAVEHEARESFRYRGKALFGPHLDLDVLHAGADRTKVRG